MGLKKHGILGIVAGLAFGGAVFAQDPKPTPGEMKKAEEAVSESTAKAGEAAKDAGKAVGDRGRRKSTTRRRRTPRRPATRRSRAPRTPARPSGKDADGRGRCDGRRERRRPGMPRSRAPRMPARRSEREATKVGDAAAKDARKADAGAKKAADATAAGARDAGKAVGEETEKVGDATATGAKGCRPGGRHGSHEGRRRPLRGSEEARRQGQGAHAEAVATPDRGGGRPAQGTGRAISRPRRTVMPRPAKISSRRDRGLARERLAEDQDRERGRDHRLQEDVESDARGVRARERPGIEQVRDRRCRTR